MNGPSILLLLLMLLLLGAWHPAIGQDGPYDVQRRGPDVLEVTAGDPLTVPFHVSSRAGNAGRIEAGVGLPSGWRVIAGAEPFDLHPGSGSLRLVSVAIPSYASAGEHVIRYAAGDPADLRSDWSADSVRVRVPLRIALDLSLDPLPERVAAGDPYEAHVLLRNLGNASISSLVHAESSGGYPLEVSPTRVEVEPGGTASVTVIVRTEPDLPRQRREILRIRATPLSSEGEGDGAGASQALDVVPRARGGSGRNAERHRLPMRATVRGASDYGATVPFEIMGSGPLFDTGSERIDVLLRGPGTGTSVLGQRDEYRVTARSDRMTIRLGDQVYGLTPLTERGRLGFGAAAGAALGGWRISGHHAWDRRHGQGAQSAGQVGYAREGAGLDLSYLTENGPQPGSLWSVRGRARPVAGMRLEAEYGAGVDGGEEEIGSSIELSGRHSRLGYRLQHLRTGSRFPGATPGADLRHGSVGVNLWGGLRLAGHLTRSEGLPGPEVRLVGARLDRNRGVTLSHGDLTSFEYRASERTALHSTWGSQDESESLRLRLGWTPGRWSLNPSIEAGRSTDRLTGTEGTFHVLQMRALYRPASGGSASASLERFEGQRLLGGKPQEGVSGRLNWSSPFGATTRASLNLVATLDTGEGVGNYAFGDVSVTRETFSGHELGLRMRALTRGRAARNPDPIFIVSYTIPLQVPVSSSRQWARVAGRVYDIESGEGLPDVLVHMAGQQTLTDGRGNLEIRGIQPGHHRLQIDRASAAAGFIPADQAMLDAEARVGHETRVEVGMIRGAKLTGTVRRYEPVPGARPDDPNPEMTDAEGVRNALVELARGSEVHRRTTDAEGRFHFSGIHPGDWTVSVAADVPAWHRLDPDTTHVSLEAGAEENLVVRVIPTPRTFRLLPRDSLEVLSGDTAATLKSEPETAVHAPQRANGMARSVNPAHVVRTGVWRRDLLADSARSSTLLPATGRSAGPRSILSFPTSTTQRSGGFSHELDPG
jgi:hypothetical protein